MTALEIYENAFDPAADAERVLKYFGGNVSAYIKAYADGAFELNIPDDVAQKIAKCAGDYENYIGGNWSQAYYELVEKPLKDIEL